MLCLNRIIKVQECVVKILTLYYLLGVLLISCSGIAKADSTQVRISGEIFIPPCKINGSDSGQLHISFDKMALHRVNGVDFSVSKTINIFCEYFQGKPYISLSGAVLSGASDNVLKTSGTNPDSLGIALYQGSDVNANYPLRIGAGYQGKYGFEILRGLSAKNTETSQFTFTAVPFKYGNSQLKPGKFSASVTMSISYL